MIKKNTKVIFEENGKRREDELVGGMPLSKGDKVNFHDKSGKVKKYLVSEKTIDCYFEKEDQIVDITYILKQID